MTTKQDEKKKAEHLETVLDSQERAGKPKTPCVVVVAPLEPFPGFWSCGGVEKVPDPLTGFATANTRHGIFFPNGETKIDLTEEDIAAIREDMANGQRITVVELGAYEKAPKAEKAEAKFVETGKPVGAKKIEEK